MHKGGVRKRGALDIDNVEGDIEVEHMLVGKTLFTVAKG